MFRKWRPKENISNWTKLEVFVQIGILVVAFFAFYFAWDASKTANEIESRNLDLQKKLYDYPIRVIPYPYLAWLEGHYIEGSTFPAIASGFLNATFIVNSPDIIKLTVENMSFSKITDYVATFEINEKGQVINSPNILSEFDHTKFGEWDIIFETNSNRNYPYPNHYNNFTYYTNSEGINTIFVSLPIDVTFFLNPDYSFDRINAQNKTTVDLGTVTVFASAYDMQSEKLTSNLNFTTSLFAEMTIAKS